MLQQFQSGQCVEVEYSNLSQFLGKMSKDDGHNYTVIQKKGATLTMAVTLSILDGFAKFFHCCKEH